MPQNGRDKPTHKIAPGEDKPTGAHLGSTKIPRTGYAQNGILNILNWDPVSKQFEAAFDFTVQDDNQNDTRVVGTVWVKELDVLR